jgi:predicted dinucleotide-binding enzyme
MIGIIGAGEVGGGLGELWVRAGHQVLLSSCHPRGLKVLVEKRGSGRLCRRRNLVPPNQFRKDTRGKSAAEMAPCLP